MSNNIRNKVALSAVAFVAVFAAVGCTNDAKSETEGKETSQSPNEAVASKAADLRVALNTLEKEHVHLAVTTLGQAYDGDPSAAAYKTDLLRNATDLSKAVGSVYGQDAEKQFLEIWNSHLVFFENYTVAAKAGDKAGMDKAVADLGGYVDAIANFFSKANPNLPKDAVAQLFTEHVTLLKGAIDAHAQGNYTQQVQSLAQANTQVGTIADTTAKAIVKQKPEMFQ